MSEPAPNSRTDWLLIAALIALVLPLRFWLLHNTEVTARDSIGFIRYALQFEQKPWTKVLRDNQQHPGYPVLVLLMSQPVRAASGETTPENMALATQLVSFLASLVLIVPVYWLGRAFFDRSIGFWGTLLFQCLPVSAQHLSDGVSEPTYLVFLVSGLLFMTRALAGYRVADCILCGVFAGLAYLTRPEGLLVLPAFAAGLLAIQFRAEWRQSWPRFLQCGIATALAACMIAATYVIVIGGLTNKPAANVVISNTTGQSSLAPVGAILFAETFTRSDSLLMNLLFGIRALFMEVAQGLHYGGVVPAALGLWWTFPAQIKRPGFWGVGAYAIFHVLALVALAMSVGYVSDRHVMILVLFGSFFVVPGLYELPRRMLSPSGSWYRSAPAWTAVLLGILFAACLPKATQRLHGNRAGNHEAGLWLRGQLKTGDVVEDDHAWSHFFAGLVLSEGKQPAFPRDLQSTCYVVTTRSQDPLIDAQRQSDGRHAHVVYAWPETATVAKARVLVYALPRDFAKNPWRVRP